MKKLLWILGVLFSFIAKGQFTNLIKNGNQATLIKSLGGNAADSATILRSSYFADTTSANFSVASKYDQSVIITGTTGAYKVWYRTLNPPVWNQLSNSSGAGTVTMANLPLYVNGGGTIMNIDSLNAVYGMTTLYQNSKKVNYTDTSSILANYFHNAGYGLSQSGHNVSADTSKTIPFTDTSFLYGVATKTYVNNKIYGDTLSFILNQNSYKQVGNAIISGQFKSSSLSVDNTSGNSQLNYFNNGNNDWAIGANSGTTNQNFGINNYGLNSGNAVLYIEKYTNSLWYANNRDTTAVLSVYNPSSGSHAGAYIEAKGTNSQTYLLMGVNGAGVSVLPNKAVIIGGGQTSGMQFIQDNGNVNFSVNGILSDNSYSHELLITPYPEGYVVMGDSLSFGNRLRVNGKLRVDTLPTGAASDSVVTHDPTTKRFNMVTQSSITSGDVKYTDTASMLSNLLRKTDTANMLSVYGGLGKTNSWSAPNNFSALTTLSATTLGFGSILTLKNSTNSTGATLAVPAASGNALSITSTATTFTGTASASNGNLVGANDTSSMLSNLLRKTDTSNMLSNLLRKTDTSTMLSKYLRKTDTSNMLSPYAQKAKYLPLLAGSGNTLTGDLYITNSNNSSNIFANRTTTSDNVLYRFLTGGTADWLIGTAGFLGANSNLTVYNASNSTTPIVINQSTNNVSLASTLQLAGYTVSTLPTGTLGMMAYVTDALTPSFLVIVVGGGSTKTPVFYNGSNWVVF